MRITKNNYEPFNIIIMKNNIWISTLTAMMFALVLMNSCKKKDNAVSVSTKIPTVSATSAVSNITATTASSGGNITSDGGATVTSRGVCWSTSADPTTSNSKTTDGTGTGTFTSSLTGLTASTTYYVRAYATNSVGTAYGTQVSFTSASVPTIPTVTTTAVSNITSTTASSGGNITADGGVAVTSRGVCWSTSANPTTSNSKTTDGSGTGIFTSSLTGLTAATTYYVRAYAINSVGTAYGVEVNFTSASVATIATVTTSAVINITTTTAGSGGNVTSDGGATVTSRGVCWNTSANPTTSNSKTTDGTGTGTFTSSLNGLTASTIYYVRAYAVNSAGTAYGTQVSFTSATAGTGTTLDSVVIGTQTWELKNLDITTYRNGDVIPQVTDPALWAGLTTGAWCYFNNDPTNNAVYGKLYNFYAVSDPRGLAPLGWHVASNAEWTALINFLGGDSVAGGKVKEAGTMHWLSPNVGATNESGFTGLPGEYRSLNGTFSDLGVFGYQADWWTSSGGACGANYNNSFLDLAVSLIGRNGFSVRCIKN
jgi:uncharacterized protein (TIGR02145 family)